MIKEQNSFGSIEVICGNMFSGKTEELIRRLRRAKIARLNVKIFKPKKAILTNLHTDIDYKEIKKKLPKNVIPAHDGLTLTL